MFDVFGAIKAVAGPITSMITGWQNRKKAKLNADLAISLAVTNAKIKKIETGQTADIAWEKTSLTQAGWKDEYWTIILSLPLIMCFIPGLVIYVQKGFEVLETTPLWYRYAVGIAIGSAFGVRKFADFMKLKKGE